MLSTVSVRVALFLRISALHCMCIFFSYELYVPRGKVLIQAVDMDSIGLHWHEECLAFGQAKSVPRIRAAFASTRLARPRPSVHNPRQRLRAGTREVHSCGSGACAHHHYEGSGACAEGRGFLATRGEPDASLGAPDARVHQDREHSYPLTEPAFSDRAYYCRCVRRRFPGCPLPLRES